MCCPVLSQVKNDFTRYWYGDEKHLDETWKEIFLYDHRETEGPFQNCKPASCRCYSLQLTIQRPNSFLLLQMDVRSSSAQNSEDVVASPSIQIGGTGKYCHQCRQKKETFAAICKNTKRGKNCPIKFCHKCLLTRYGENAEEVAQLADWACPKCRGFCNCSLCQKRRGEQPTGQLYRNAKESGFTSVAEMLAVKKTSEALNASDEGSLEKEVEVLLSGELTVAEEILLPPGMELKEVSGIKLPPKDVGNALQFLEFCRVFGKGLDLKEGEAQAILEELAGELHGHNSFLISFIIRLLTLITGSSTLLHETNSWLKHLEGLILQSQDILNVFPVDWFQEEISGYHKLDLSTKFKLIVFLCDEVLNTEKMRNYIVDESSRHTNRVKEAKLKIASAKKKVKCLEQKLRDEKTKVVPSTVSPFPLEEHDALIKIRAEVDEAHEEMLRLKSTNQNEKNGCDAMRIHPEFVDNNGMTFWNIQSYNGESVVLLQDVKIQDETVNSPEESWFVYSPEEKDEVDKYIFSRAKRPKEPRFSEAFE